MNKFIFLCCFILPLSVLGNEQRSSPQFELWSDIGTTLNLAWRGSYEQFQSKTSYAYLGTGSVFLAHAIDRDDEIIAHYGRNEKNTPMEILDALGVIGGSPIWPAIFYIYGRNNADEKLLRFTMESVAAIFLAQMETVAFSFMDIHERPSKDSLSKWETSFRGDSSFPSGHVIPWYIMGLKTMQFYGPAMSSIPFIVGLGISYERIQSRKHYWSDIIGSMILSGMASEGVRKAAGHSKNHSFYKNHLENDFSFIPIISSRVMALSCSYQF